jgi:hypothetical protein
MISCNNKRKDIQILQNPIISTKGLPQSFHVWLPYHRHSTISPATTQMPFGLGDTAEYDYALRRVWLTTSSDAPVGWDCWFVTAVPIGKCEQPNLHAPH